MRSLGFALVISFLAGPSVAEPVLSFDGRDLLAGESQADGYRLGGSVKRRAFLPEVTLPRISTPTLRLSIPTFVRETGVTRRRTPFGGLAVIFGESWNGREVFHLGTALTRGQTTAGVNVTYEDANGDLTGSEFYVDYALSKSFSVGLSSILSNEVTLDSEPVPQVGINAELEGDNGVFLQGGVADADETDPIFGLAVGFKF